MEGECAILGETEECDVVRSGWEGVTVGGCDGGRIYLAHEPPVQPFQLRGRKHIEVIWLG